MLEQIILYPIFIKLFTDHVKSLLLNDIILYFKTCLFQFDQNGFNIPISHKRQITSPTRKAKHAIGQCSCYGNDRRRLVKGIGEMNGKETAHVIDAHDVIREKDGDKGDPCPSLVHCSDGIHCDCSEINSNLSLNLIYVCLRM